MDVLHAIRTRRTIGKVLNRKPERKLIESILEAGTWAPNHYRTEPWEFIVLSGDGRDVLGKAYGDIAVKAMENPTKDEMELAREKGYKKARRAPVIIVVIMEPGDNENVVWIEEAAACACSVQNMLLTAHSLGLASIWRTGKPIYTATMKNAFHVSEKGQIIGLLYLGYPAMEPKKASRTSIETKTKWWGDASS